VKAFIEAARALTEEEARVIWDALDHYIDFWAEAEIPGAPEDERNTEDLGIARVIRDRIAAEGE
jgi:hypothetical protein